MTAVGVLKTRFAQLHRKELLSEIQTAQMDAALKHIEADAAWLPWRRYRLRQEATRLHEVAQSMLDDYNVIYRSKP